MSAIDLNSPPDEASSLLENLYQMVRMGSTNSHEFDLLDTEIYERLHSTYAVADPARRERELEPA